VRPGSTVRRPVERVALGPDGVERRTRADHLAAEEPLEIRLAEHDGEAVRVAVTMRTPGADFELAAGFLFSEGLVDAGAEIASLRYCTDRPQDYNVVTATLAPGVRFDAGLLARNFYAASSCGVCGKASIEAAMGPACAPLDDDVAVDPAVLVALPERLRAAQRVFDRTGGLHGAAHFTAAGEMVRAREDVGRHNALDKVIGAALLAGEVPLRGAVVMVSGRVGFELVQKAARAGVPVLAGVSAPSSLAVALAEETGMTLAGFVRGPGFNLYAGGARVRAPGNGAGG
jgi:FdhD protein